MKEVNQEAVLISLVGSIFKKIDKNTLCGLSEEELAIVIKEALFEQALLLFNVEDKTANIANALFEKLGRADAPNLPVEGITNLLRDVLNENKLIIREAV